MNSMGFKDYLKEHSLLNQEVRACVEASVDSWLKEVSREDNVTYVQTGSVTEPKLINCTAGIAEKGFTFYAIYKVSLPVVDKELAEQLSDKSVKGRIKFKDWHIHLEGGEDIFKEENSPELKWQVVRATKLINRPPFIAVFDNSLVPILGTDQYDDIANWFLRTYQPEVLSKDTNVGTIKATHSLGLEITNNSLLDQKKRKGKTYFFDDEEHNISAGTVMVATHHHTKESKRFTIIHECVHWFLHRYHILFDRLYVDKKIKARTGRQKYITELVLGECRADIERKFEVQANRITARILMPTDRFQSLATTFYNIYRQEFKRENGQPDRLKALFKTIEELSQTFEVSIQATRRRLMDFYREAEGVKFYLDGHYLKSHTWAKGSLKIGQSFSISLKNLTLMLRDNEKLQEAFKTGKVVFVDCHVCLNQDKYVRYDNRGNASLTEYARYHIDECCLIFQQYELNDKKDIQLGAFSHLGRTTQDIIKTSFKWVLDYDKVDLKTGDISQGIGQVAGELPRGFSQALTYLMKWRNLTQQVLSDLSNVGTRTISQLQNDKTQPTLDTVIALCVGLQLPYQISQLFLETAGIRLKFGGREGHIALLLISVPSTDIRAFNKDLGKNGYAPLKSKLDYGKSDQQTEEKTKAK